MHELSHLSTQVAGWVAAVLVGGFAAAVRRDVRRQLTNLKGPKPMSAFSVNIFGAIRAIAEDEARNVELEILGAVTDLVKRFSGHIDTAQLAGPSGTVDVKAAAGGSAPVSDPASAGPAPVAATPPAADAAPAPTPPTPEPAPAAPAAPAPAEAPATDTPAPTATAPEPAVSPPPTDPPAPAA